MTTPTQLADLVLRTVAAEEVDERIGLVVFRAELGDAEIRRAWLSLRAHPPAFLDKITISDALSDADLADDAEPEPHDRFQIVLSKVEAPGELRLLFAGAITGVVEALVQADCVQIGQMGADETFATYRSRFQLWTLDPPGPYAPSELLPDPRGLSTDLTVAMAVPPDLRPWLLRASPARQGSAFQVWRAIAGRRLLASIADQVSKSAAGFIYHFSGPPSRAFPLTDEVVASLCEKLTKGATWVFTEGQDVDTRHLLLANEWARSYRPEMPMQLGDGSLESARGAYSAYVKASSRETLKALADLRKAVIEETQKISQRAQDLAGAMWKDLAVAAAPFVLKILPDSAKVSNRWVAGGMGIAAAAFLIYSYSIQVYINHRYFKNQGDARGVWRQVLNVVLSQAEIEEFSEAPIKRSVLDYGRVRNSVGVAYGLLVAILAVFAIYNLGQRPAPANSPPPAKFHTMSTAVGATSPGASAKAPVSPTPKTKP